MNQLIDYKALKRLADTCRKAGIKSYKDANCEFTLSDTDPISSYKKRLSKTESASVPAESVVADTLKDNQLTEEQLLFYSVANIDEALQ